MSSVSVGMDVHKESITVAVAAVQFKTGLGHVGR